MATLLIILNLILLESLLSIDNAAVLAVIVRQLPAGQQKKALRYGIIGAYVFRGLALMMANYLVNIMWLKIIAGLYLIYLAVRHFMPSGPNSALEPVPTTKKFWHLVVIVEAADLLFSIDNIFAAVAMSTQLWVIITGVCIGILAIRFMAGFFIALIDRYPAMQSSAFIVIACLGLKLTVNGIMTYLPANDLIKSSISGHTFDLIYSLVMLGVFFLGMFFNKRK